MRSACPVVILLMLVTLGGFERAYPQNPSPAASTTPDEVVKITTKVVQLDALVVDKDGKQVRGLSADDFEILQDGKPQKITGFSYVSTGSTAPTPTDPSKQAIAPPVKISASNARRIITFIVDDGSCSVSNVGMRASREGIEKFIREMMQPTDLVAIYRTRSGSSMFQTYTNDKAQLLKAAHKIQWYPAGGSCNLNDGSYYAAAQSNTQIKNSPLGTSTQTIESDTDRKLREHAEDFNQNSQVVGVLGVVRYVVQGLARVPGRKVVFLLSDGIPLRSRSGEFLSAADVLRDLTDLANRSSVVFNTIDPRGVFDETMIEARDQVYVQDDVTSTDKISSDRSRDVMESRDGLAFLARETGGKYSQDQNFLDVPIDRALKLETGYYLIAYEPTDETFKGKKFNKIEIKVKGPGLKVISRSGFQDVINESAKPKRKSEESDLYEAIAAPLPTSGLNVRLTAYFVNQPETGDFVRALFHLDGNEITFVDDANGMKKAVLDVVAVTMNEKNQVVDEFTRSHTFKIEARAMPYISKYGLDYSTDVPIKKPGTYNFRVAVKDTASKQLGSSSQMIQVPDLKKSGVFLSALTIAQVDQNGKFAIPAAAKADNAISVATSPAIPAVRVFRAGEILGYAYTIYNSQLDKTSNAPKVSIQVDLYRDGQIVIQGIPQVGQFEKQADWTRINDYGYLKLNAGFQPGQYALHVVVRDLTAGEKSPISSQTVDFEVVE